MGKFSIWEVRFGPFDQPPCVLLRGRGFTRLQTSKPTQWCTGFLGIGLGLADVLLHSCYVFHVLSLALPVPVSQARCLVHFWLSSSLFSTFRSFFTLAARLFQLVGQNLAADQFLRFLGFRSFHLTQNQLLEGDLRTDSPEEWALSLHQA